jgi:hypothetical protein
MEEDILYYKVYDVYNNVEEMEVLNSDIFEKLSELSLSDLIKYRYSLDLYKDYIREFLESL